MVHKAFALDWNGFDRLLRPIFVRALQSDDTSELIGFIETHREQLCDPDEQTPLSADWQAGVGLGDVQRLADFALTRFYDPANDDGLGYGWLPHFDALPLSVQRATLGETVGEGNRLFDPGRLGSYFQSPVQVQESAKAMAAIELDVGEEAEEFDRFAALLARCATGGFGLYVTF